MDTETSSFSSSSPEPLERQRVDAPQGSEIQASKPHSTGLYDEKDPVQATRRSLPIFSYREDIIAAVDSERVLVVVGDTGSGKTTQIPQYLLETWPNLKIAVTQPRRIAAISAARRVSEEHMTRVGNEIGYAIRFERCTSPDTKITYMTDGTLLRECITDSTLSKYDVVILDEAHERGLETDVLFGLLKRTLATRQDLKVIVMSATLDVEKFSDFFGTVPIFSVPGRVYDVEVFYQKKMKMSTLKNMFVSMSVETVVHIHKTCGPGDVYVCSFLSYRVTLGHHEIHTAINQLLASDDIDPNTLLVLPLYSTLDTITQRSIFNPAGPGRRKVVFSTNIAQTSVTIPGIKYVIDSGFVKQKQYSPATGMDALMVVPISKSAATQRAGRAGRVQEGVCYRLYSKEAFEKMEADTVPEIQRSSLIGTVLQLKTLGVDDILTFDFLDAPDPELLKESLRGLYLLGAIDQNGHLLPLGRAMSQFPTLPHISRALLSSLDYKCSEEMLTLAAMLSTEEIWTTPKQQDKVVAAEAARRQFKDTTGDHITLINVYDAFVDIHPEDRHEWCRRNYVHYRAMKAAVEIRSQLRDILIKTSSTSTTTVDDAITSCKSKSGSINAKPILQCLCTSFFMHLCKAHTSRPSSSVFYHYVASSMGTGSSLGLYLSPLSVLSGDVEWVIYHNVTYTTRANMRVVSRVLREWCDEGLERVKWGMAGGFKQVCGETDDQDDIAATSKTIETLKKRAVESYSEDTSGLDSADERGPEKRQSSVEDDHDRDERARLARERYLARKKSKVK